MSFKKYLKKVLVIGSGPIIIGQAAEFDYSGTQACRALKEEGLEVILINSNPATIMTDNDIADKVYIEPLTLDYIQEIIKKEKPDGLLPTLGGQTGLNLAVELSENGILEKYGVRLLGTELEAIEQAEDRELFRNLMKDINEPVIESMIVNNIIEANDFTSEYGFPIIVRPAYTLGGSGGGIVENQEELENILELGLKRSRINQVLLERSLAGWKEIEYEVIRDSADNCITICNMENIDPVGVHTGDSVVVAPSQTLNDKEYQKLRTASIKIIRALKIEGGCNIQFALNPESNNYYVIEVNPRVSRSSALASKATGYPIAKISAKIALGLNLDEIKNPITQNTYACFEPALDYVVSKIPRWPFDKFEKGNRSLGSQMKATGEVMAIGRNFTESFLKAVASLDQNVPDFFSSTIDIEKIKKLITKAKDERIYYILQALYNDISPEDINKWSGVDLFYLYKFKVITEMLKEIEKDKELINLKKYKKNGFSDVLIAKISKYNAEEINKFREDKNICPVYKMVDTCAAEFSAATPYYYSSYESEDEVKVTEGKKVLVIGSGPIRIGQGIEFDYSSVHAVRALQEENIEAIIVNNNPETVSTDYDIADKLYFEPLTFEYVENIIKREGIDSVVLQFGGQTAINLAKLLDKIGVKILGTNLENIELTEDREKFNELLLEHNIPAPTGINVFSLEEALELTEDKVGFPVLVRPSFVLGGRGMEIINNIEELKKYLSEAIKVSPDYPVLIDKYINGKEIEVDAVADGENILIPGIIEHIERAGVHSGDSTAIYPAQNISKENEKKLIDYTEKIVKLFKIKGLINIQFVIDENENIYVLEVNPRSSRTVPILSKVTGVPMVKRAIQVMLGKDLNELEDTNGLLANANFISVKMPVFSFEKLTGIDVSLTPEMKSTGEVLGTASDYHAAVKKALEAANIKLDRKGSILFSLANRDKNEGLELAKEFMKMGFNIYASKNTADDFIKKGVDVKKIDNVINFIKDGKVDLVINTPTQGNISHRSGFKLRRAAVEFNVPCLTSLDTSKMVLEVLQADDSKELEIHSLDEYKNRRF